MTAPNVNDVRARLLPCPFCGGIARLCIGYHAKYDVKVACDDCSSEGALYGDDDFKGDHAEEWTQNAIAAWNRHADLAGEVRELVEAASQGLIDGTGRMYFESGQKVDRFRAALAKFAHPEISP